MKRTLLLTGFGPFPGVPLNPSGRVAGCLAAEARRRFSALNVVSAVLPTEWLAAPLMLEDLVAAHRPHMALHFGVSH